MIAYLEAQLAPILAAMGAPETFVPEFETPGNPEHGDLSSNAAMKLAKPLRKAPRAIAEQLAAALREAVDADRIAAIEIAGPGFLNFRFSDRYLVRELEGILSAGSAYGRTRNGEGKKVMVEYVSANPTGPLTVGHGRNAVLGDTIASLLEAAGYDVTREYYFNDGGRQMRILGMSVRARYEALCHPAHPTKTLTSGEIVPESFPEDGYLGGYIGDIAAELFAQHGTALLDADLDPFRIAAQEAIFADITRTLKRLGIVMDVHFNERTFYENGAIERVIERLREAGFVEEREGAVWFLTSKLGKLGKDSEPVDTVLVKSTGEPTYRLPDICYHIDKLDRGFDLAVDIFGADHIATYPDVLRAVEVLGYDPKRIDVVIYQFVTLVRSGTPVKMSTRKANYVTLDELMDDVGSDVTRFFFLMRAPGTHLEFDLDLAREASEKNPVFYLQYAHARVCAIVRKAADIGLTLDATPNLALLTHEAEVWLIKELMRLPAVVVRAAEAREPHLLATYLREVAVAFTQFYGHCRIVGEAPDLALARLHLAEAARLTLANGLGMLGISAPDRM